MKNLTPRIEKAIDIFLDAINEGTLKHSDCRMCAVGNLVANGLGIEPKHCPEGEYLNGNEDNGVWYYMISDGNIHYSSIRKIDAMKNVNATDFNPEELAIIEKAFEYSNWHFKNGKETTEREGQIIGLEAVVKVMMEFDDVKENVKEVFTSKAELIKI